MILKMENYQYPSREEWLEVSKTLPKMNRFGFPFINEIVEIIDLKKNYNEVKRLQHLYEWDGVLNKKTWNLRHAYVNAIVNYNRGIAIHKDDFEDQSKLIHLFQFEFYCETSFYYIISIRDIVLQIINIADGDKLPEDDVKVNTLKTQLQNERLKHILDSIPPDLKIASNIRNSMTHRFSMFSDDNRSTVSEDGRTYESGPNNQVNYDNQVKILKDSVNSLYTFFRQIREELIKEFSLEID